jgi:hypothetical protein
MTARSLELAIHILAMPNPDHQYRDSLVLNVTDQPIITHPISPQTTLVAVEGLAHLSRVFSRLYSFLQKSDDRLLGRAV